TSADILEGLVSQHEIIPLIIEYRLLSKLLSTFVEGLEKLIDPRDNRVHTTLNQVQTSTGRLSSTEPNLQNIPIRMSVGNQIRKAFAAPAGWLLVDADYSQIELRLLAHLSGDPAMIEAFAKGEDIHTTTATGLFDVMAGQVTREQRSIAKTVNFSIVYGVSDYGLARSLGIPVKEAHKYISEYDARYPEVRKYLDGLIAQAYENGYVETILGRRRYMHELKSANRNQRNFGERAAMNMPLQGTAADLIKIAMVRLDHELRKQGFRARLILQVHDELIVEAPLAEVERVRELMRYVMENVVELRVPLLIDIDQGDTWYNCKIAEGEPEPEPPAAEEAL
ncbi:MAG: DNA polymerase I, partial [Ruminococcaceae bacterium]|nr:DNA polymerase I [Oscillospiraceae bacterium]